jgi:hypothetical protein
MKHSASTSYPTAKVRQLINCLRSYDGKWQADAVREAVSLGSEGMEALLLAIQQQGKHFKGLEKSSIKLPTVLILGIVVAVILAPNFGIRFLWTMIGGCMVFLVYTGLDVRAESSGRTLHRLIDLIVQLEDQRKVGLFVETLHACSLSPSREETIKKVLTPMLLTLRSSDIAVLSQHHRQLLCQVFNFNYYGAFFKSR